MTKDRPLVATITSVMVCFWCVHATLHMLRPSSCDVTNFRTHLITTSSAPPTPQDNILSLYLCDTNTDKDIHISDRLVDQGLAIVAMDTVEDEARFDGIHLEPPPSTVWYISCKRFKYYG